MSKLKEGMIPYIEADEIESMVQQLAESIDSDYGKEPLVLVCPLKGSFIFVADLARKLKNPNVEFEFVQVKSLGKSMRILKDISIDIADKNVLICEEIIDAGRTLSFLKKHLQGSQPRSTRIATLIDKPARREIPLRPDYIGKVISDRYVIGYGMDSDELGRNYADIYNFMQ